MPALRRTLHWLTVLFPLCDLEGNEWEEHPKYELTGEGNSVATKERQRRIAHGTTGTVRS